MKASRAKELLGMASFGSLKYAFVGRRGASDRSSANFDPKGITVREDKDIRDVWKIMSSNASYADALRAISRNRELTKLEIKDGCLTMEYDNGDFVTAALDLEATAELLDNNLETIAPEVDSEGQPLTDRR